jgi:uncharacterized membrane protein YbhN (UPF0104 family)
MSQSRLRGTALIAARAAVSFGLIALVLRGMDFGSVLENLRKADVGAVLVAVLVTTGISLLQARRWEIVLARMAHSLPFADALKLVLIGYFFNQTLPSTVGGDAYRAWGAYRLGIRAGDAVSSVIVDRVLAVLALMGMILAGSYWLLDIFRVPGAGWVVALAALGAVTGTAALLLLPHFAQPLKNWRLVRYLLHISDGVRAVVSSSTATLQVVLLTFAGFGAISFVVYLLAQGMGIELGFGYALLFVPLVTLITVLPISIAGWGLRESSMVVTLGLIGVQSVDAFSLSVLFGLVVMASGIPGGIIWLSRPRARHAEARRAEPHGTP